MTPIVRQRILRMNGVFLGAFGILGLMAIDVPGIWWSVGAVGVVIRNAPHSAIGFVEAHGLAIIVAAWMLNASRQIPNRSWHVGAAAVHLLLGTANVIFWQIFAAGGVLWLGWLVTPPHFVFAIAEIAAALSAARPAVASQQADAQVSEGHPV